MDAAAALTLVDLLDRTEVHDALRTALKIRRGDWAAFDEAFVRYWEQRGEVREESAKRDSPRVTDRRGPPRWQWDGRSVRLGPSSEGRERPEGDTPGYSPDRLLRRKPFEECSPDDLASMERLLAKAMARLATRRSRRYVPVRRGGKADLRRSFRRAIGSGGEFLALARRNRALKDLDLVVLCDTSGSMDPHTRFLLTFLLAVRHLARRADVFVFNTALTRITPWIAPGKIGPTLERLAGGVPDWSGGTRIGESLAEFVSTYQNQLVATKTVVVIVSDGLDTGDAEVLRRAMRAIHGRARKVIWLNPCRSSITSSRPTRWKPWSAYCLCWRPERTRFPAHSPSRACHAVAAGSSSEGGSMIPAPFDYHAPESMADALELLERYGESAKILSGGQSLLPLLKLRFGMVDHLIDIGRIPGLEYIHESDGQLRIGGVTRESALERSELIRTKYPILLDTASVIADPLVRNRATVGGNLAHGDPANDHPATMLVLGAEVTATGPKGQRTIPVEEFFADLFTTALAPDEILTEIRVPVPAARSGGAYLKLERKVGDYAAAAAAVSITLGEDGSVARAGIGLTNAGPTPVKAVEAEGFLTGKQPDDAVLHEAGRIAGAAASPSPDHRGSVEYKREMARVLVTRAARKALDRAGGR